MDDPTTLEAIERLGLSVLLAALLGWDREMRHKAAGLRTHMMVALGAAGFTLLGIEFMDAAADTEGAAHIDLSRIIQGVVGGVGFLGAGAIIQARGNVAGMTTAAGIWVTASIGVACALGEYVAALLITGLAFIVLSAGLWAESRIKRVVNGDEDDDEPGHEHPQADEPASGRRDRDGGRRSGQTGATE